MTATMTATTRPAAEPTPIFRGKGEGEPRLVLGVHHICKANPAETGAFMMIEASVPPGAGTPMHRHAVDLECFYVLDGEIVFSTPDGEIKAGAGACCILPANGAHAFRNDGPHPARMLVVASPGLEAERFFVEIDQRIGDRRPDAAEVTAIAARHSLEIVGAPPV